MFCLTTFFSLVLFMENCPFTAGDTFVFLFNSDIRMWRNVIVFQRLRLKGVGFHLEAKSNPNSIRGGCRIRPFIEVTFSDGQRRQEEKFNKNLLTNANLEFYSVTKIRFHLLKVTFRILKGCWKGIVLITVL